MKQFVLWAAIGSLALTLPGCLLNRPAAPSPRYIQITLPPIDDEVPLLHKARLTKVTTSDPFMHDLMHERHGELRADATWKWLTSSQQSLERALLLQSASQGIKLVDQPNTPSVSVELIDLILTEDDRQNTMLQATALTKVVHTNGTVHVFEVSKQHVVSRPFPGDLAHISGQIIAHLAQSIWEEFRKLQ